MDGQRRSSLPYRTRPFATFKPMANEKGGQRRYEISFINSNLKGTDVVLQRSSARYETLPRVYRAGVVSEVSESISESPN